VRDAVVNAWSTTEHVSGDEVPGEKQGNARSASQAERAFRNEFRHRALPYDTENEEASRHQEGVDDERMREDVLSERPPLPQQAEAEPDGANCAIPVVQKASAPLHPADPRFAVLPLKITPNDPRTVVNEWETKINYIAIAASEYRHR
jgi:hypothetical protein